MGFFGDTIGCVPAGSSVVGALLARIYQYILDPLIAGLFALALIFFLWGVAQYIWQADVEAEREKGRQHMLWGVLGMFIMLAAFSIIRIIANTIGCP